jgi:hypothetical protein
VDPQRYAQVKRVFREALRWAPAHRAEVAAALAGDDAVRDEALSLLAHHREAEAEGAAAAAAADPQELVGAVLGERYRVEARVRGGYRAEDTARRRPVALEELPEDAAPVDALIELSRQAGGFAGVEGACAWASPAGPRRFAVVAWLEGPTLAELRGGGGAAGWPLERVVRALGPIAEALAIAADRGVVHGGVHAARVVWAEAAGELAPRLLGLGAAQLASSAAAPSRIDPAVAAAAAPEQLSPELGPIGPWTDVYGLALLCVELMLGRPAAGASVAAALARTRDEAAQPAPRAVGLEVADGVEAVLARALALRPMERYQDVRRFWAALRESVATTTPPTPPPPPARSRRWPWSLRAVDALGVLVAVAIAALAVALQRCG